MSDSQAFEQAQRFFAACEAPGGWAGCRAYVADGATFFATYHARHAGDGGPVPPTNRETQSHYVYVLEMDGEDKVARMTKIWNAHWAMRELGWL